MRFMEKKDLCKFIRKYYKDRGGQLPYIVLANTFSAYKVPYKYLHYGVEQAVRTIIDLNLDNRFISPYIERDIVINLYADVREYMLKLKPKKR